jgi:DNA mismatch repair protein MSH2
VELPVVMAVTLSLQGGGRRVGVAYLDAGRHRLGAAEFADDEQFCTLEAVALQLGAKECAVLKVPSCLVVKNTTSPVETMLLCCT